MLTTLIILASLTADGRPAQAPRPPQAPPARKAGNCGDPNCPCGCAQGGPCVCTKAVKKFTNTSLVCEGESCQPVTAATSQPVTTITYSAPIQYAQPTYYAPPVYYQQPVYRSAPTYFGGGFRGGFGGGGSCSGGG